MLTVENIKDDEIGNIAEEVLRLARLVLGESESGDLPANHPLVQNAKRKLAAIGNALYGASVHHRGRASGDG